MQKGDRGPDSHLGDVVFRTVNLNGRGVVVRKLPRWIPAMTLVADEVFAGYSIVRSFGGGGGGVGEVSLG